VTGGAYRDRGGRVHLALELDTGGGERLTLTAPLFGEDWQNDLAAGAANTSYAILRDAPDRARTVALARKVMDATSRLAEGLLANAPEGGVACKAGCAHCCYQSVGVTPPEALAIADHLRQTLSDSELAKVAARVAALHEKTQGLSTAERFSSDHPCPFLDVGAGRCSIYEARPLSCRGMNSLDAGECERRLRDAGAREAFLSSGAGSRSFMEPIRAFHAISAGMQIALAELYNLDMRPLDLTAAMHLLLAAPDALPSAWLEGRPSFEPARGGDSTDAPTAQEISGALPSKRAP
jgi:Fe-S-cluster containining protein